MTRKQIIVDDSPCELCGEDADAEMGLFRGRAEGEQVWAHGQCGLDAGMDLA